MHVQSLQLCLTLCSPMDCSPPGSSVHGKSCLQARLLGWVAMPSSRGSSAPRHWTHVSYVSYVGRWVLYLWCHLGSPSIMGTLVQPTPQKLIHIAVGSMPSLCNRFGMITCNINFGGKRQFRNILWGHESRFICVVPIICPVRLQILLLKSYLIADLRFDYYIPGDRVWMD